MPIRRSPIPFCFALLCCALPGVLRAQTPACIVTSTASKASLSGTVTDRSGSPIAGATVAASCGGVQRNTHTDGTGHYTIELPAGNYTVDIEATRFAKFSRDVQVTRHENGLDVSLELSNVRTTISVNESIGYLGEASPTATKTSSALLDVPQSITIVTRKLLIRAP